MTRRRGPRYRAVSPEGQRHPFRRSLGAAVRDGVYAVTGWNVPTDGYRLVITCDLAITHAGDLTAKGWTFEVLP